MTKDKNCKQKTNVITINRKASYEYFIEQKMPTGIVLRGWEVKSIRKGRIQINDGYIFIKEGEVWLFGVHISPLPSASTHVKTSPQRTRKLLLNKREIVKLIGLIKQKGYTLIPLKLYWQKNKIKCEVGLVKGKKLHDKRATIKERDWKKQKQQLLRRS